MTGPYILMKEPINRFYHKITSFYQLVEKQYLQLNLVIVNFCTKIIYYKLVKVNTIDTPGLVEEILDIVVQHYNLPNLIISDQNFVFTLKFWLLLCYFLRIQQKLSITFHY